MKCTLRKTEPSQIPPAILSSLKDYQSQIQSSVVQSLDSLPAWFIQHALKFKNNNIPRLELLCRVHEIVQKQIPDRKYINTLFLQQSSIVDLLQESDSLIDIAFILNQHLQLKVRNQNIQYAEQILNMVSIKTVQIIRKNSNDLALIFGTVEVQNFISHKERSPDLPFCLHKFQRDQMQIQYCLIFSYIIKPLLEKKNLTSVYENLYPIIMWFIVIRDNTQQKERILLEISRKIDIFLWANKSMNNITLTLTFNTILNLLSVKYTHSDSFSPQALAPILNRMRSLPFNDLILNWMSIQKFNKKVQKSIENIFRNSLSTGCNHFCFQIIDKLSQHLHFSKKYEILFHIFDSFIRKEYLDIKLATSMDMKSYMNTLMFYAIGFINRDRLDGETELDRLAVNLSLTLCKDGFRFDNCFYQIIKFFRMYENRFQFLSAIAKKLVTELEQIYKVQISMAELHQSISQYIFKDYDANYDQNDIYSLQRSSRYAGLENLGNTCYMNSFMQALFMTKKFKSQIIKAQDEGNVPQNRPLFESLVKLFSALSSKTSNATTDINPVYFKQCIPEPFKSSWEQHDSAQFGRIFLDCLKMQIKGTSLGDKMERFFVNQVMERIICKNCSRSREKKQQLFEFILNMDDDNNIPVTVSDLLIKYFIGYQLDDKNGVYCPDCRTNKPSFVIPSPLQISEYFITTLSIFKYDKNGSSKINKPLNFQFSINFKNILPKIARSDDIYELYAFILHIGAGVERGHYQCFARNLEQNPMLWFKFDDHYVTQQQINSFEDFHFGDNEMPYILFYSNTNRSRVVYNTK